MRGEETCMIFINRYNLFVEIVVWEMGASSFGLVERQGVATVDLLRAKYRGSNA